MTIEWYFFPPRLLSSSHNSKRVQFWLLSVDRCNHLFLSDKWGTLGELLPFVFQIVDSIGLTNWLGLELLKVAFQNTDFGIHALYLLFGPFLSFLWELEDFESLFKFLFEVGYSLCIFLRHFESESQFGSLVGDISWELSDFVIEDSLVIMATTKGSVEPIILMFESNQRLISCEFYEDLNVVANTCWNSLSRESISL